MRLDPDAPKARAGRIARLIAGWALTLTGLILIPVPIIPGLILLVPGLTLLAAESQIIRRFLRRHRERRLMRRAMREAERVGVRFDLGPDSDDPRTPPPPDGATGSGG